MADHHAQRIGVRWVIKQLPFPLMVVLVIVGIVSTFEPILNGWVLASWLKSISIIWGLLAVTC